MDINILLDASGSMTENGKISVVKYLVSSIEGYSKENESVNTFLYQWGETIDPLDSVADYHIQEIKVAANIADFAKEHNLEKILIISDGGFSRQTKLTLKGIQSKKNVFCIGVGCDCNFPSIRNVLYENNIFKPQDIITCVESMKYVRN